MADGNSSPDQNEMSVEDRSLIGKDLWNPNLRTPMAVPDNQPNTLTKTIHTPMAVPSTEATSSILAKKSTRRGFLGGIAAALGLGGLIAANKATSSQPEQNIDFDAIRKSRAQHEANQKAIATADPREMQPNLNSNLPENQATMQALDRQTPTPEPGTNPATLDEKVKTAIAQTNSQSK